MSPDETPFQSQIVKLDLKKSRFTLPVEVVRSAGWGSLRDGEPLVAEFVAAGHYRLHRMDQGQPRIAAAQKRAAYVAGDANKQAAADQFRQVVYYKSDNNRVWVGSEVVFGLCGPPPHADPFLYLQAATECIDVMTHARRMERLKSFAEEE